MARPALLLNHPVAEAARRRGVNPMLIIQRSKGWVKVHEEGRCRMCQRPSSVRPLTRHHLIPLRYFRAHPKLSPLRHADANIVPLCTPCHCDVELTASHSRVELRQLLGSAEIAFAIQVAGRDWLDRRYPQRSPAKPPARRPAPPTTPVDEALRERARTQFRRLFDEPGRVA